MADHDHSQPAGDEVRAHHWGHEADLPGGSGPGAPGADENGDGAGGGQDGRALNGDSRDAGGGDQGVFRWPATGLPRFFGQPPSPGDPPGGGADGAAVPGDAGRAGGGAAAWNGVPVPPRVTLAPQAPYPEPAAPPEPPGPQSALYGLPDDYDAVEDYDAADAYGPPGGYGGYSPADAGPVTGAADGVPEAAVPDPPVPDPADSAASPAGQAGRGQPGGPADAGVGTVPGGGVFPGASLPPGQPGLEPGPEDQQATGTAAQSWQPAGPGPEPAPAWAAYAAPTGPAPVRGYPEGGYPVGGYPAGGNPVEERPGLTPAAPAGAGAAPETADSLTADLLLPGRRRAPADGWRRLLYRGSGGLIRAPESAAEQHRRQLTARACTPVAGGHHRVAVLSLKGGVGKTTTTMGLGSTLASLRGDRVIAVDANPDRGTLSDKLRLETAATVRDLLNERGQVQRYADVRAFTTQAPSRLEVLASDRDPTVSVAFSEADYVDVAAVLEHYYSICITDCGTGLLHSAMAGVLRLADQIVLVSSPSVDGARSASATLDWLAAHNYGNLVRGGVVVLSAVQPRGRSTVDMTRLEQHFAARCRAVVRIPYDAHLAEGAEVDLGQLGKQTADAYLALAAEVGDGFTADRRPARHGSS
ncbi:MAG: MinD/ParA family ATP-binding protein [Gemmatimonadota bacterium]